MKIGQVEIKPEDLKKKPEEPMWTSPYARKDCDCYECSAIIKYDAFFIHNDNDGLEGKRLIDAVSKMNGWIEDGPYVA